MLELIVKSDKENKEIELMQDGELIEFYTESEEEERNEGNIYLGVIKDILPGMQSAFVDIGTSKNGFIHLKDILPKKDVKKEKDIKNEHKDISDVIKREQPIIVQVRKDSNDRKGAKLSTHISLPSKYVVFTPNVNIITVSQKIEDEKEANRLMELAKKELGTKSGVIIRTSAEGKTEEIIKDIKEQKEKWDKIVEKYNQLTKKEKVEPTIIYQTNTIIEKIFIDLLTQNIENVIVNDSNDYNIISKFLKENSELKKTKLKVKSYEELEKIYNIQKQKERMLNRKIWLKNGGFITIDKTEALTAIDVNTGKYTGKYTGTTNLEQTVYIVNTEATIEIAKQLRLRDIGGIVVIDYIDMKNPKEKEKIEELLKSELKKDRAKTQVEGFSRLDLMEVTRKHICSHR